MAPANDMSPALDIIRLRRTLQTSLARLMDAQDYIAGQLAALAAIESQVRVLALRESSRSVEAQVPSDELRYLCDLQEETNTNFRVMRQTYADLSAQIADLMQQHEWLYDATFAQAGHRTSDQG